MPAPVGNRIHVIPGTWKEEDAPIPPFPHCRAEIPFHG
jgi:hypothetical protein